MTLDKYRHPFVFYGLSTAIPWLFWMTAAYLSHLEPGPGSTGTLILGNDLRVVFMSGFMIIGLAAPMVIAVVMMVVDKDLKRDLFLRLNGFHAVKPFYLCLTCLLMPASILAAQAVSLLFGHSVSQFGFSRCFSFSAGLFPAWFLIFLAPVLEELAWHTYGTDCLRRRFNLFTTSIIFAVFWALWHAPLSFIKDYYHSNLTETGWLYSLNFSVSLIPYVLLMNWLYYKTNRNILVAIVFHITAGLFNEIFQTHPDSKVIQTVLLLALSLYLIHRDRAFFFTSGDNPATGASVRRDQIIAAQ
ncbi:type II CAAX endopeptidase family protein [Desulfatiferula olefinivorans]